MSMLSLAGFAAVTAGICLLLRQYRPEYAWLLSIACGVVLLSSVLPMLQPVWEEVENLLRYCSIAPSYVTAVGKTLGIGYLTSFAADACRDAGENGMAAKVELCGKGFVLLVALPMFKRLLEMAFSLIGTGK